MTEVIKTVGLCKENILFDVNFSMKKGEMAAVMGPSGSGKSTLLYQLSGMDRPDEPTGALNKAASEEIMEEFVRFNREGMSVLIVTHDSKVASCCDRILYMVDGKISGECVLGKYEISQKHNREIKVSNWLEKHGW